MGIFKIWKTHSEVSFSRFRVVVRGGLKLHMSKCVLVKLKGTDPDPVRVFGFWDVFKFLIKQKVYFILNQILPSFHVQRNGEGDKQTLFLLSYPRRSPSQGYNTAMWSNFGTIDIP